METLRNRQWQLPLKQIIAILVLLFILPLGADTIYLKNGQIVKGEIISQDADTVRVKTSIGEQLIQKVAIKRIVYPDVHREEKLSQEQKDREEAERKQAEEAEARKAAEEKAEREKQDEIARLKKENQELLDSKNKQEEAREVRAERAGWPSVWRSLALPGLGQYYRGDRLQGGLFMGASALSLYYWYDLNRKYHDARKEYTTASRSASLSAISLSPPIIGTNYVIANDRRNRMQSISAKANFVSAFFIATYIWSAADAIIVMRNSRTVGSRLDGTSVAFVTTF